MIYCKKQSFNTTQFIMKCKTNPWAIVLVVLLTAVIVGSGAYYWQTKQAVNPFVSEVKSKEVELTSTKTSNLESYENRTLNVAFSYPQDWGSISQENDGTDHVALSVFEAVTIFLAADNGDDSVGRGAYWGDDAELIDSQKYVDDLCRTKSEAESCAIKINSFGVEYAKVVEEVFKFGDSTIETNYYIYNPNSEFRGIIFSTERLRGRNIQNLEEKLESLVDSFYFIVN